MRMWRLRAKINAASNELVEAKKRFHMAKAEHAAANVVEEAQRWLDAADHKLEHLRRMLNVLVAQQALVDAERALDRLESGVTMTDFIDALKHRLRAVYSLLTPAT